MMNRQKARSHPTPGRDSVLVPRLQDELASPGSAPIWWDEAPESPESVREAMGILLDKEYHYTLTRAEPCSSAGPRLGALIGLTRHVNWYAPIPLVKPCGLSGAPPHQVWGAHAFRREMLVP
jgi:hypothetical protein